MYKICDSCYGCFEQRKVALASTDVFKWDSLAYARPHDSLVALWANDIGLAMVEFVI